MLNQFVWTLQSQPYDNK